VQESDLFLERQPPEQILDARFARLARIKIDRSFLRS
jgi:hypothetical protein